MTRLPRSPCDLIPIYVGDRARLWSPADACFAVVWFGDVWREEE